MRSDHTSFTFHFVLQYVQRAIEFLLILRCFLIYSTLLYESHLNLMWQISAFSLISGLVKSLLFQTRATFAFVLKFVGIQF